MAAHVRRVESLVSDTGHLDDAYRLLLQRECPSWLYPVIMDATTIWERWDAMLPAGRLVLTHFLTVRDIARSRTWSRW